MAEGDKTEIIQFKVIKESLQEEKKNSSNNYEA